MSPSEKEQRDMDRLMRRKTPSEIAKIEKDRVSPKSLASDIASHIVMLPKDQLLEVMTIAHDEGVLRGYGTYWSE